MTSPTRGGPNSATQPALTDDYYETDYIPEALLREWRDAYTRLYPGFAPSALSFKGDPGAECQSRAAARADALPAVPHSAAIDTQVNPVRPPRSSNSAPPRKQLDFEETSVGSEHIRHHRYEKLATAYAAVSDPYDLSREVSRQEQFLQENRRLAQPFVAGGGAKALNQPTRLLLGDCVRALYRTIARDWPEAEPSVISTAEDLIVVFFSMERLSKRQVSVVLSYMNACARRNEAVLTFKLTKVPEGWDVVTEDGHLMYALRPPWVRNRRFLPDTVTACKAHP